MQKIDANILKEILSCAEDKKIDSTDIMLILDKHKLSDVDEYDRYTEALAKQHLTIINTDDDAESNENLDAANDEPENNTQNTRNEKEDDSRPSKSNNPFEDESIRQYLKDLSVYPLLTKEQEISLANKIKQGSKTAKESLINSNLRLVVKVSKRFRNKGLPYADIIQEGNIGLMKAANKYDPDKGYRFSTYATYWIVQSINIALHEKANIIKIPTYVTFEIKKINQARKEFYEKNGREIDINELSQITKISVKNLQLINSLPQCSVSLEDKKSNEFGDSDKNEVENYLPDTSVKSMSDELTDTLIAETVKTQLDTLPDRERHIIESRYGFTKKKTLQELADEYGLTRERIRQIESKTIEKLRNPCRTINEFMKEKE